MDYNKDILQLQAQEMLARMRPKVERRLDKIDTVLRKLKTLIEKLPECEPLTLAEAEKKIQEAKGARIPFPEPQPDPDTMYTFQYSRPSNINIIGSFARKTAINTGEEVSVDLAVTMPSEIFQEKDYLNYRYFHKRAFYLAYIATRLLPNLDGLAPEYAYHNDNHLQPIIVFKSLQDISRSAPSVQIRLLLAADEDLFPRGKLTPDKNCVRSKSSNESCATPFYNATLRSEMCTLSYLKLLHAASSQSEGFSDSCMLGAIWLRQRGFKSTSSGGGFGPFEWACLTALLTQGSLKHDVMPAKSLSGLQIFRAVLRYLSVTDLNTPPAPDTPMLFDNLRGMNVLFKMSPWSYTFLRNEASRVISMLNNTHSRQFENCFISNIDNPVLRYDHRMFFPLDKILDSSDDGTDANDRVTKWCTRIFNLLKRALGDRLLLLNFSIPCYSPWSIALSRPLRHLSEHLMVGMLVQSSQVNRLLDRGPPAEEKIPAADFRAFWGEKAELRRFKDGSIIESVVWSDQHSKSVLGQIVEYVFQRHLDNSIAQSFESSEVLLDGPLRSFQTNIENAPAAYTPAIKAFETLESHLRSLQGMPLHIRQVSPADPQLRYTSIDIPIKQNSKFLMHPAAVYVSFEGSHRWPNILPAIQRTKIAFLLKMGDLLEERSVGITTRLGLETTQDEASNAAYLEIQYSSGAMFHLRIQHEGEMPILGRMLKSKLPSDISRETAATALSNYKREFVQSPLHSQAIRTLCTRFPLLSSTIRLVKKWRDCQLLSRHFRDELIELLTAHVFLHPFPFPEPGTLQTGFLQTLNFLAKWNWQEEPLIIDFNGEMHSTETEAIRTRLEAWRSLDPAMNRLALFVATNLDHSGSTWTERNPSKMISARMSALAKAACAVAEASERAVPLGSLFVPRMTDYDFIIHLNPELVSGHNHDHGARAKRTSSNGKFKNLQPSLRDSEDEGDMNMRSFRPAQLFLDELESLYSNNNNVIVFFYDASADTATADVVVAGLWNPLTTQQPRPWKVQPGYSTVPQLVTSSNQNGSGSGDVDDVQLTVNKTGILSDIARLGGDMILKIEVKGDA